MGKNMNKVKNWNEILSIMKIERGDDSETLLFVLMLIFLAGFVLPPPYNVWRVSVWYGISVTVFFACCIWRERLYQSIINQLLNRKNKNQKNIPQEACNRVDEIVTDFLFQHPHLDRTTVFWALTRICQSGVTTNDALQILNIQDISE
jgi:hypothetical protein